MNTPTILQNDFQRQWADVSSSVIDAVQRVGASGWYILGKEVQAFETELAALWGLSTVVGVANGMDALEIGLRCLGLEKGDKVLTTPLSAFATTLAIIRAGGIPVFVDVDECGAIDLQQCRALLERDPAIRYMVPVHLFGFPIRMDALEQLKSDFDLLVVEDCAQAIGATDGRRAVGTVGQVAATSFYPTKNLGAFGDGGALLTNDEGIATRAKSLRNYGQSSLYVHDQLGLNSRLDELHAAILREALLPKLENWTTRRRANAKAYREQIRCSSIRLPSPHDPVGAVWHLFPVQVQPTRRESFREHLRAARIATGIHYPAIIPDQAALAKLGEYIVATPLDRARQLAASELSLPVHPFLTDAEVSAVIGACNSWQG